MVNLTSVCVYCGSSSGRNPAYLAAARALGAQLAESEICLVYGGAQVGLMGALADATLASGGEVTGVIPRSLVEREVAHPGLDELVVVDSMHERKSVMAERADAFVALPGGVGTLEELFEVWTWAQLGIHDKPVGVLNVEGYYDSLFLFLDQMQGEGFVAGRHRAFVSVEPDARTLLERLEARAAEGRSPSFRQSEI